MLRWHLLPHATVDRGPHRRLLGEVGVDLPAAAQDLDDVLGGVYAPVIGRLAAAGVVQATGPSTFNPAGVVTREQMASFLMRAADRMVAEGLTEPPYGDNREDDGETGEPQPLEPGLATGECRDPEVIRAESGSIDVSGEVDTYRLDTVAGQRIAFRADEFGSNVFWALRNQTGEDIFSFRRSSEVATFDAAGTYTLRIAASGTATGSYRFSVFDVTGE